MNLFTVISPGRQRRERFKRGRRIQCHRRRVEGANREVSTFQRRCLDTWHCLGGSRPGAGTTLRPARPPGAPGRQESSSLKLPAKTPPLCHILIHQTSIMPSSSLKEVLSPR